MVNYNVYLLLQVLENIEELADSLGLKYSRKHRDPNPIEYYSDSESE